MEPTLVTSVPDGYNTFITPEGTTTIVLNGLELTDTITVSPLQAFFTEHYGSFFIFYSCCFIITITYLILRHIAIPLWRKYQFK